MSLQAGIVPRYADAVALDVALAMIDGGSGTDTFVPDPDFSFNAFNFEA